MKQFRLKVVEKKHLVSGRAIFFLIIVFFCVMFEIMLHIKKCNCLLKIAFYFERTRFCKMHFKSKRFNQNKT